VWDMNSGGLGLFDTCGECSEPVQDCVAQQLVFAADYIVFRYKFDDGSDLDTRTNLTAPESGAIVGWDKDSSWYGSNSQLWYQWGGDNMGTGYEAVVFYVNSIRSAHPSSVISGSNAAFWYGDRVSGNVHLEITAYQGGVMVHDGFNWTNPTGAVTGFASRDVNVALHTQDGSQDGEQVATWSYSNSGVFTWDDHPTPPPNGCVLVHADYGSTHALNTTLKITNNSQYPLTDVMFL